MTLRAIINYTNKQTIRVIWPIKCLSAPVSVQFACLSEERNKWINYCNCHNSIVPGYALKTGTPLQAWLETSCSDKVDSKEQLKLLGFIYEDSPTITVFILIQKIIARTFILRKLVQVMPGKDLLKIYSSIVRSVLKYSSVSYHSWLSNYLSNKLERLQKHCLGMKFGFNKSYSESIGESRLQTLSEEERTSSK